MKLSIVIVNFNTGKFLGNCIDSVVKNTKELDFEIIVVDNASTDKPVEKLRTENLELRTKIIENKKNVGFAAANNQGIKQARSDYILLLNPDTLICDNVLPKMIDFMEQNREAAIASCKVILKNGELDDACHRGFPTPWNAFCQFSGLSTIFSKSKLLNGYHLGYSDLDKTHEIDACAGAFMLIRRKAGEEVSWLDEDYFWYGEDLDFCFRVKKAGWKIMFIPQYSVTHFKGVSSGIKNHSQHLSSADKKTKLLATRARFDVMRIFYEKHYKNIYPVWLTWLVLKGIDIKEYISLLRFKTN